MSVFRTIAKQSATYGVATAVERGASIVLLPIYTRYLSPADYGILELLATTITVTQLLVGLRLQEALFYFYSKAEDRKGRERAVTTTLGGAVLLAVLVVAAAVAASGPLSRLVFETPEYGDMFTVALTGLALNFPAEAGFAYLRAIDAPRHFTVMTAFRLGVSAGVAVSTLVFWNFGVWALLWGNVAGAAATAAYMAGLILSRMPLRFDPRLFASQIAFSAPISLAGIGMLFLHYGDRYFLQRSVTLAAIGVYALAYKIGMIVSFVHGPFIRHWTAQMYGIVERPDGEEVYVRVMTYLLFVLTLTALALSLFSRPILSIMAPPEYHGAVRFVPWLSLAYVIRGFGDQVKSVFNIHRRTGYHVPVAAGAVAVVGTAYATLIPRFGVAGAVASTVIGFTAFAALSYFFGQRVRRYRFETWRLVKIAATAGLVVAVFRVFQPAHFILQVLWGIAGVTAWFVLLLAAGFFQPNEIEGVRTMMKGIQARIPSIR